MSNLYSTVYKSVVRAVNDLVKAIPENHGAQYWTWESRESEDKLPQTLLIGVNGFTFDENLGLWLVNFGITISTYNDANLLEEAEIIDMCHSTFGEHQKIALRDPGDGTVTSELVTVHWHVMPMVQTEFRNYRNIGVEMRRTGS